MLEYKRIKIVLITKNETELLIPWIKYHGEIFGYSNLYIIDDSTEASILNYYDNNRHLGINIYRNNNNLNTIEHEINKIMTNVKDSCDFLIKVDTDEFIGVYNDNSDEVSIEKCDIFSELTNLPTEEDIYRPKFCLVSCPKKNQETIFDCTTFIKQESNKVFFNSNTFEKCDLGCHGNECKNSTKSTASNLVIIHYHYSNFNNYVETQKKALLSHNYIVEGDNIQTQIDKLSKKECSYSFHKVRWYKQYLLGLIDENTYYKQFELSDSVMFQKIKIKLCNNHI